MKESQNQLLAPTSCAGHWGGCGEGQKTSQAHQGFGKESLGDQIRHRGGCCTDGSLRGVPRSEEGACPTLGIGRVPGTGIQPRVSKMLELRRKGTGWGGFPPVASGELCPVA